jgi:hypothetical protein
MIETFRPELEVRVEPVDHLPKDLKVPNRLADGGATVYLQYTFAGRSAPKMCPSTSGLA